jgi:hypothetical protein
MTNAPQPCFTGEVMLAGWGETHNGGAKLTFWLPEASELEAFRAMTVKKGNTAGQRFMCVLVEIGDDEKPVTPERHHLSSDAHLMITGERFVAWVRQLSHMFATWDAPKVREWVKMRLRIESLSQLDTDPAAAVRFHREFRQPFAEWNDDPSYDSPEC